jgi:WD40 repeat protein/tetratricopeptide (TPR) repeat protein
MSNNLVNDLRNLISTTESLLKQHQEEKAIACLVQILQFEIDDGALLLRLEKISQRLWQYGDNLLTIEALDWATVVYAFSLIINQDLLLKLTDYSPEIQEYIFMHLPKNFKSYLANINNYSVLAKHFYSFLTSLDFIEAKIIACGVDTLLADYDLMQDVRLEISEQQSACLQLIQGAIQLSAHILAIDPTQTLAQLLGRLLYFDKPVHALLTPAKQRNAPLLYPMVPSLTPPGRGLIKTLIGHEDSIRTLAITPDNQQIISGSDDKTIKVWDLQTGKVVLTLQGYDASVRGVVVTPDGSKLVSCSHDQLKVWDLRNEQEVRAWSGHNSGINAIALTPDGNKIISASTDSTIKVWNLHTGEELDIFSGHSDSVNAIAITSDGGKIVSGSEDKTIKIWNFLTKEVLFTLSDHESTINDLAITPNGEKLVSVADDPSYSRDSHNIRIWDINTGQLLKSLRCSLWNEEDQQAVKITPDGEQIISVCEDNILRVWNFYGELVKTFKGDYGYSRNNCLVVTADGKQVISGSNDRTIKVWDLQNAFQPWLLPGHSYKVDIVAITPDAKKAASVSLNEIKIWDLQSGKELLVIERRKDSITTAEIFFTPDSKRIIGAIENDRLKVWDLESGEEVFTLEKHDDDVTALAVAPDGKYVVSGSYDRTLKIWNLQTGEEIQTLPVHENRVSKVVITPNNEQIISTDSDGNIKAWNLQTGEELWSLRGHQNYIHFLSVTPDSHKLISSGNDGRKIWDLVSKKEILTLRSKPVGNMVISSDGTKVITTENIEDIRVIKVWDLESGRELLSFDPHHSTYIKSLSIIPNTNYVVSMSSGSLKIWNLDEDLGDNKLITSFSGDSELECFAISRDGQKIIVGETSGQVHLLVFQAENPQLLSADSFVVGKIAQAEELLNQGKKLYRSGQYGEAIEIFMAGIKLEPSLYELWWYLGKSFAQQNNLEAAEQAHYCLCKASDCIKLEHQDKDKIFVEILFAKQNVARQVYNRAVDKHEDKDMQGAIADLNRVLQIQDDDADALSLRAYINYELGNFQQAIIDCESTIKASSSQSLAYYVQGKIYAIEEDEISAFESYTKAIESSPKWSDVYYDRANILTNWERWEEALEDYTKALTIGFMFVPHLAKQQHMVGMFSQGEKPWRLRIGNPSANFMTADAYAQRGWCLFQLGNLSEAFRSYEISIKADKEYYQVYCYLGVFYKQQKSYRQAIEVYNLALKGEEQEEKKAKIYYELALVRAEVPDYRGAIADLQFAANLYQKQENELEYQKVMETINQFRAYQ